MGIPIGTTATPFYQDLSFKVNSGNTKAGKFTLFGLGGKSNIDFEHDNIDSTDLFADPSRDSYFSSDIGLAGLKHFIRVNDKSYFSTVIGASYAGSNYLEDTLGTADDNTTRVVENKVEQIRYSANTSYNSKINSRLFIKVGAIAEIIKLNLAYRTREFTPDWLQVWDHNDYTELLQGYAHAKYNINARLTLNAGLHSQFLTLNNSYSIEPRLGLKFQLSEKQSLNFGYGLHSQMQPTDVYFFRTLAADGTYVQTNKDLDFTRSQHYVLAYDVLPFSDWRSKTEVYFQQLNNVPVTIQPSSYSMLNAGASFNPNEVAYLQNSGTGTNYGFELTVEKFFSKGYFRIMQNKLMDYFSIHS
jgi:hypothetical protein